VEVDGGQHSVEGDAERTVWLEKCGYTVLRLWNNDVLGNIDGVMRGTADEIGRRSPPPPAPPS